MMERDRRPEEEREANDPAYEAPEIESVVTPEEIEREVHYAGVNGTAPPG